MCEFLCDYIDLFSLFQLRSIDRVESSTFKDNEDFVDLVPELVIDQSDDSSSDWSWDSGDTFVTDEDITNRDR